MHAQQALQVQVVAVRGLVFVKMRRLRNAGAENRQCGQHRNAAARRASTKTAQHPVR
jgi:hypothetical protein